MSYICRTYALILFVAFVLLCVIKDEGPSSALASPLFRRSKSKDSRGLPANRARKLGSTGNLTHQSPDRLPRTGSKGHKYKAPNGQTHSGGRSRSQPNFKAPSGQTHSTEDPEKRKRRLERISRIM
ncbi:uncharacterized protein LOC119400345 isoform X2 [Rhipicephalus sanguineus]|uniref:uncharacterized protein LOC119400345 isoform X2 n=1 Tax=Rhipicephalus sanguineus TaxID=34632 RepID=UPI001893455C|nr:uncharacterized protein LOC119400345 isoform X2 [Rhipicephalus sanguineus]